MKGRMSKQFILIFNNDQYNRLKHLVEQDELRRSRTRAYYKSKTGNNYTARVEPLNPQLLSVIEMPKDAEVLVALKKISEMAPPVISN